MEETVKVLIRIFKRKIDNKPARRLTSAYSLNQSLKLLVGDESIAFGVCHCNEAFDIVLRRLDTQRYKHSSDLAIRELAVVIEIEESEGLLQGFFLLL